MKTKYILLAVGGFILTLIACKKDNNLSIIGKWQENKVRVYQTGPTGLILNDTTYSGQTFTNQDYVQFNSDGTCIISTSHYYYPTGQGFPNTPPAYQSATTWNFTGAGPKYIIDDTIVFGRPSPTDTATVSSPNNLVLHQVVPLYLDVGPTTVFDVYYTR